MGLKIKINESQKSKSFWGWWADPTFITIQYLHIKNQAKQPRASSTVRQKQLTFKSQKHNQTNPEKNQFKQAKTWPLKQADSCFLLNEFLTLVKDSAGQSIQQQSITWSLIGQIFKNIDKKLKFTSPTTQKNGQVIKTSVN